MLISERRRKSLLHPQMVLWSLYRLGNVGPAELAHKLRCFGISISELQVVIVTVRFPTAPFVQVRLNFQLYISAVRLRYDIDAGCSRVRVSVRVFFRVFGWYQQAFRSCKTCSYPVKRVARMCIVSRGLRAGTLKVMIPKPGPKVKVGAEFALIWRFKCNLKSMTIALSVRCEPG